MSPRKHKAPFVDVVGVGLNATDTIIEISYFPNFNSKTEFSSAGIYPGGQVASALVACRRWGLTARYIGTTGDDPAADLHSGEMARHGVEAHLIRHRNCTSQVSYILAEQASGERTIIWKRDSRLTLRPAQIRPGWITQARVLLVDGHDTIAATYAAKRARASGIPVVADIDNLYPGVKALLQHTDHLFSSQEFPERLMKHSNLLETLPRIALQFGCRVTGATLGRFGAIAWDGGRFHYSRGFRVRAVDTTGAGDIFHAGLVYGILQQWDLDRTLEFSNAAAALACTAVGARSGIASLARISGLISTGDRSPAAYSAKLLRSYDRI